MGKRTGRTTTTNSPDVPQDMFSMFDVRSRLIASTVSMGWRMAIMIIIPIFIGLKLDDRFNSRPSYVLAGFFLAIGGCAYIIYSEYKAIAKETEELYGSNKNVTQKKRKKVA